MHLFLWKPISHCASLLLDRRSRKRDVSDNPSPDNFKTSPSILRKLQRDHKLRKALQEASGNGSLVKSQEMGSGEGPARSGERARPDAESEFLTATALAACRTFGPGDPIPGLDEAFSRFLTMYPKYQCSEKIDRLRVDEYSHLSGRAHLDYVGFGLFSSMQTMLHHETSAFGLSEITANLSNHALHGGPEPGTVEHDMKAKIMDYLNVPEHEYGLVFTVSRGSAFRLLADSYPFRTNKKLLTMFDHESQSVNFMAQSAREKGAKVRSAWFEWPTLKLCSTELRKQISSKKLMRRKKDSAAGLFVFPVQSRVTGAKYSYQWMALAQQNNWHVLLDAGSLGPKDMDSLGLSLFRPDFIITSFYRVFGDDPTGFGCLLIKKSVMASLQNGSGHPGSGIVKINPVFPMYLSDSMDDFNFPGFDEEAEENDVERSRNVEAGSDNGTGSQLPAFSGAYTLAQVRDVFESEMEHDNSDGASTIFEETESVSFEEMMKSPGFSDESSDNSLWIDLGFSPLRPDNVDRSHKHMMSSPLPPLWFSSRKSNNSNNNLASPNALKLVNSPVCENQHVLSFDDAAGNNRHFQEIEEEPDMYKESAIIRKETEGEFRLLERREKRVSFSLEEENDKGRISHSRLDDNNDDDCKSNGEFYNDQDLGRAEPEIKCRHLDHVNMLGLNSITCRLRFLINWLVTSLLQLRLPNTTTNDSTPLVHIYGPKIKYERGAAVAFNIRDRDRGLISPEIVQKLAEGNDVSLSVGILSHIRILDGYKQPRGSLTLNEMTLFKPMDRDSKNGFIRVEVVTASLAFLTNFDDVYKLWAFVAKFLDPSFVKDGIVSSIAQEVEE